MEKTPPRRVQDNARIGGLGEGGGMKRMGNSFVQPGLSFLSCKFNMYTVGFKRLFNGYTGTGQADEP